MAQGKTNLAALGKMSLLSCPSIVNCSSSLSIWRRVFLSPLYAKSKRICQGNHGPGGNFIV
jgi:hypothetical protein